MESVTPVAARRRRRSLRTRFSMVIAAAGLAVLSTGGMAEAKSKQPKLPKATIKAAQTVLGVEADGVIGPKTRTAIRRFQRRKDLVVDGILGPQTLTALGVVERATSARADDSLSNILERIAECESGGDPTAVSASGKYRGKYQFSRKTWRTVGGKGDPAGAPEAEQDRRARRLYKRDGPTPWPNCA